MSRLTKKCIYHYGIEHYEISDNLQFCVQDLFDMLGEIEDIMEDYDIESVDKLREIIMYSTYELWLGE